MSRKPSIVRIRAAGVEFSGYRYGRFETVPRPALLKILRSGMIEARCVGRYHATDFGRGLVDPERIIDAHSQHGKLQRSSGFLGLVERRQTMSLSIHEGPTYELTLPEPAVLLGESPKVRHATTNLSFAAALKRIASQPPRGGSHRCLLASEDGFELYSDYPVDRAIVLDRTGKRAARVQDTSWRGARLRAWLDAGSAGVAACELSAAGIDASPEAVVQLTGLEVRERYHMPPDRGLRRPLAEAVARYLRAAGGYTMPTHVSCLDVVVGLEQFIIDAILSRGRSWDTYDLKRARELIQVLEWPTAHQRLAGRACVAAWLDAVERFCADSKRRSRKPRALMTVLAHREPTPTSRA